MTGLAAGFTPQYAPRILCRPGEAVGVRVRESLLHERATLEVNIADWLCPACQRMRLDNESDVNREGRTDRTLAWNENDSRKTLFYVNSMLQPPGPAAFTGEVVLTTGATDLLEAEDGTGSGKFCWVVAHELVHVIEAMRVIVPAFMDWETYWSVALQNGVVGDSAVVASKGKVTATVAEDSVNETLVPEVEKALKKSAK